MITPDRMDEILGAARILSRNLLFLRVDMYLVGQTTLIGELTSVVSNGLNSWDYPDDERDFDRNLFGEQGFCLRDFPELQN